MRRDARVYLADAIAAGELIATFVEGKTLEDYSSDPMLRSAVERQFEIVGEAVRRLTAIDPSAAETIRSSRRIIAFRNQLAHGYHAILNDVVWAIATNDLPSLLLDLRATQHRLATGQAP